MKFFDRRQLVKAFIGLSGLAITGMVSWLRFKKEGNMSQKKIKFVQTPQEQHWVGDGFFVHTLFHPVGDMYKHTTPFILMAYAPPKNFPQTSAKRGVGEHPHRGFETVTFAFKGEIEHRDSSGGGGVIGTGDLQWMTAAAGVVHDEFHSRDFAKVGGDFEMVQLWVNLPAKDKMTKPKYQGRKDSEFPRVPLDGGELKVYAGEFKGESGPCETFTPINMYNVNTTSVCDVPLKFDEGSNTLILVMEGTINYEGKSFEEKSLLVFEREGEEIPLKVEANSRLLVLNGEPIDEPIYAHGPFVMNNKQEIIEAIEDFQAGKMGRL